MGSLGPPISAHYRAPLVLRESLGRKVKLGSKASLVRKVLKVISVQ